MTAPFYSRRDGRFRYATDAIDHIEQHNCVKGCKVPKPDDIAEYGPGGLCNVIALVAIGDYDQAIDGLADDGENVTCTKRQPLDGGS